MDSTDIEIGKTAKHLAQMCAKGQLDKAKYTWGDVAHSSIKIDLTSDDVGLLNLAALSGNIDIFRWVLEITLAVKGVTIVADIIDNVFEEACLSGNIELVKEIFGVCRKLKSFPYFVVIEEDPETDILKQIIIKGYVDIFLFLLKKDEEVNLNLELDLLDTREINGIKMYTTRASELFCIACLHNQPDIAAHLLHRTGGVDIYKSLFEDLIIAEYLESADIILTVHNEFTKLDYSTCGKKVIRQDNIITFQWMDNNNLIKLKTDIGQFFKECLYNQSEKIIMYIIGVADTKNYNIPDMQMGYTTLLTGPIKPQTEKLVKVIYNFMAKKTGQIQQDQLIFNTDIIKIHKTTFKYGIESVDNQVIRVVETMIKYHGELLSIDEYKLYLQTLLKKHTTKHEELKQIFELLFERVKTNLSLQELKYLEQINSDTNKITSIGITIANEIIQASYKKEEDGLDNILYINSDSDNSDDQFGTGDDIDNFDTELTLSHIDLMEEPEGMFGNDIAYNNDLESYHYYYS